MLFIVYRKEPYSMANFKANRTEEDILREMTAILRELKDPRIDPMLTVVRAELSRDLSG